ncbi:896_t:CDS:2 [Diversispora eburnea]|uniref:896_t:CDS:1 n=1 Tax=Diversispora eburnea TaxID=1213867 RepID=A0A9N9FLR9_9GLOM|nr:896_t:CDS:2 [Diversispora eburnea]
MLLWEIAELKVPFENETDISHIRNLVVKRNYREKFTPGIVPQAWTDLVSSNSNGVLHQDPFMRPSFTEIFLIIKQILKDNQERNTPSSLKDDETIKNEKTNKVEEAITETKKSNGGDKLNAWKCFEVYAELGDIKAKYWKGYFLYYDILKWPEEEKEKNKKIAAQLFKEAASDEGDMAEAQLRYGFCLFKGEGVQKDQVQAAKYFMRSANNGNPTAMYNIGNIYYHGYGIPKNLEEGERYLRLAAYNQQKKAVELCRNTGVGDYDTCCCGQFENNIEDFEIEQVIFLKGKFIAHEGWYSVIATSIKVLHKMNFDTMPAIRINVVLTGVTTQTVRNENDYSVLDFNIDEYLGNLEPKNFWLEVKHEANN